MNFGKDTYQKYPTHKIKNVLNENSTLVTSFQGHLYTKNFILDGSKVPPLFTHGHWKIRGIFYYKNIVLFECELYLKKISSKFGLGL